MTSAYLLPTPPQPAVARLDAEGFPLIPWDDDPPQPLSAATVPAARNPSSRRQQYRTLSSELRAAYGQTASGVRINQDAHSESISVFDEKGEPLSPAPEVPTMTLLNFLDRLLSLTGPGDWSLA